MMKCFIYWVFRSFGYSACAWGVLFILYRNLAAEGLWEILDCPIRKYINISINWALNDAV